MFRGPGPISGLGIVWNVICGLSLLLVLVSAPRVFLRALRFSSLHKTNISKFQFDYYHEPPAREVAQALPRVIDIK